MTQKKAQNESAIHQAETSALLEGARAILEHRNFQTSARIIFDQCNNLIGSTSGYVALLSDDGKENEVLFLEAGGEPCSVDPTLPMPIRGLRGEVYKKGKAEIELQTYSHALEKANENTLMLYREIERKNRELQTKTKNKTEFLRHMGHEIRTPINSIITLADLLSCKIDGDLTTEQSKQVDMIKESTSHLLNLVNDLLDLSRIEAGIIDTNITEFTIGHLFDRAMHTIEPLAAEKGLKLHLIPHDSMLFIKNDFRLLLQILLNLLGNAVKFTEIGSVTVCSDLISEGNEARVVFEVRDTDVGIPTDVSEAVFDEFSQFHLADGGNRGSGLGLPITKETPETSGWMHPL